MYESAKIIEEIIEAANLVVVIQADNPDADSLGSALALEHILGDMGKEVKLYCAVDVPGYLRYMEGWDRVQGDLPNDFDASIIVDASTLTLFERLVSSGQKGWLATKPCIVLDHHHTVDNVIDFDKVTINDPERASTGELIYLIAKQLQWPLNNQALEFIANSILGDTQGLSNQLAKPETYRVMADIIEAGVDRAIIEEKRRAMSKMPLQIYQYKADLIKRTKFAADNRIAHVCVSQDEINKYSPLYNPAPLIQADMLQTSGVSVAIVFKRYDSGKLTAAIRCNPDAGVAAQIAEKFGGGGHQFASGFKIESTNEPETKIDECIDYAKQLLDQDD